MGRERQIQNDTRKMKLVDPRAFFSDRILTNSNHVFGWRARHFETESSDTQNAIFTIRPPKKTSCQKKPHSSSAKVTSQQAMHPISWAGDLALSRDVSKQPLLLEGSKIPPPRISVADRLLRKRTDLLTPDDRTHDGVTVKSCHTGALLKKGKPEDFAVVQYLNLADEPIGDSDQFRDVEWNRGSFHWTVTASVTCPLVESGTSVW